MFGSRDSFRYSAQINEIANEISEKNKSIFSSFFQKNNINITEEQINQFFSEIKPEIEKECQALFLQRVYRQAKQVSQIIAFIWCWIDFEPCADLSNFEIDWRDGLDNKNAAKELRKYFTHPTESVPYIGENLEILFAVDPKWNDDEIEVKVEELAEEMMIKWFYGVAHRLNPNASSNEIKQKAEEIKENIDQITSQNIEELKNKFKKTRNLLRQVFQNYKTDTNLKFPIFDKFELGLEHPGLGYTINVDINSFQGMCEDTDKNHPSLFIHTIPFPPRPQLGTSTVTKDELQQWIENREENKYYADNAYIPTTTT